MLDEYISGDARRVRPEAPVPVVEAGFTMVCCLAEQPVLLRTPRHSANESPLAGATGDDYAAGEAGRVVQTAGVDPSGLVVDPARPTTTNLRGTGSRSTGDPCRYRVADAAFR